jgi:hypothetical protein
LLEEKSDYGNEFLLSSLPYTRRTLRKRTRPTPYPCPSTDVPATKESKIEKKFTVPKDMKGVKGLAGN